MRTKRTSQLPDFFTQVIGSLPRPQVVRDLFTKRDELSPDRFRQLLDDYVVFAIDRRGREVRGRRASWRTPAQHRRIPAEPRQVHALAAAGS